MTRTRLRDLTRKRLGETTVAFWTDVELNDWLNDAQRDICWETKCRKSNGYITTTEDVEEYTISDSFSDYISILEVYMYKDASSWEKLTQTDRDQLNSETPGWLNADSATPYKYYWSKEEDILYLYPGPDSTNAGTNYLRVWYARDSVDMIDDADTPTGIPSHLQRAMVDFVVATGYETRGYGDKANDAWGKYNSKLKRYQIERDTEEQVDNEGLLMKNYRNI